MAAPKKLSATVAGIKRHSESVIEYLFSPNSRVPSFKPGQFLHLAIDPYDPSRNWPESRVFSIANAPESEVIRIVISVKGRFTARMAAELKEGSTVWLKFPYGNFTFETNGEHLVLIAGGTGISPYISLLEHCHTVNESPPISLYYGVRNEQLAIFESFLQKCKVALPQFNFTLFCEDHAENLAEVKPGLIDIDMILNNHSGRSDFYLSGPPVMIDEIKKRLLSHNISAGNIFIDEW
jgi:ferredoxin-NADP reductase